MTQNELVKHLNSNGFFPEVHEGVVTLQVWRDLENYDDQEAATDEELKELGFVKGFVDAHSEGSDRGGYVPYVRLTDENGVQFETNHDEHGGEWQ